MLECKHCECSISGKVACPECGITLSDQCKTCHMEVAHGVIKNQNIHIVGSGSGMSVDQDGDAYGRAER